MFAAALLLALSLQAVLLFNSYAPRVGEIYRAMGQPGLWRSANFTFGQKVADFYAFLNARAPVDSTVVVPARTQSPVALFQQVYVELFVYPRAFAYCENTPQNCVEQHQDLNSTVILTDWKSIATSEDWGERLQTFDEQWGILLPSTGSQTQAWTPYGSIKEIAFSLLLPVLFLLVIFLPGVLTARYTLPTESPLLHLALGTGSGLALFTLSLCVALLLGLPLSSILVWVLPVIGWIAFALVRRFYKPAKSGHAHITTADWFSIAALLAPISLAFVLSVGNGFTETDELILWSAKGFGISLLGFPDGTTLRGTLATWYPLNTPLIITSFLTLFGERLPESKLVFPFFLVGSASLVYVYLRRKTRLWVAAAGALLISTTPSIFFMSTLAHGNVPTLFYILGSVILLELSQQAEETQRNLYWLWSTLFLLFAAWTRPEGIHLAWAITAVALLLCCSKIRQERTRILISLIGLLAYTLFWAVVSPQIYSDAGFTDSAFSSAFAQIIQGDLNLQQLGYILRSLLTQFLSPREWGALGFVTLYALLILLVARQLKLRNNNLLLLGLTITAAITAGFWLNTYTTYTGMDLGTWVNISFIRLVVPGLAVVWLASFASLAETYFPKGSPS